MSSGEEHPAKRILAICWRGFVRALWLIREGGRALWSVARAPLVFALNVVAALLVLFEEWGWKPLSDLIGRLARFAPIARLERWVASLPPYPALLVFALPSTVLLPLKFVAVWLLANDQWWAAIVLFTAAKVVATAVVARVFILTKPALMQLSWFAWAYNWFMPWKDHLFGIIRASWVWRYGRMVKTRVLHVTRRAWAEIKPQMIALWHRIGSRVSAGRGDRGEPPSRIG